VALTRHGSAVPWDQAICASGESGRGSPRMFDRSLRTKSVRSSIAIGIDKNRLPTLWRRRANGSGQPAPAPEGGTNPVPGTQIESALSSKRSRGDESSLCSAMCPAASIGAVRQIEAGGEAVRLG